VFRFVLHHTSTDTIRVGQKEETTMKTQIISLALVGALAACQPPGGGGSKELVERIEKLEKKVEALEKKPAGRPAQAEQPPQTEAYKIPVGDSPILGKKDAKINVVIFSDYQCPFCSRVDPTLREIVKDPELAAKVNVVFKQFPLSFHKDAKPAAKAALAAKDMGGDEKFWAMSEKLYANQRALTPENFVVWAKEIGLDGAKFEKNLKDNDAKYEAIVTADTELGQKAAKVRGTPSIFVNGWELRQRSVDGVKAIVKEKNLG
jgi:protein-disulfide isomerase